ncbi:MAG: hypothetical protein MN733_33415, partial [Nitrososphaera sp.]|nr:hypothetical protein [Nitrososphaera sp.]
MVRREPLESIAEAIKLSPPYNRTFMVKHSSVADIEGFRVLPIAPVSSAFKIALTRIRKRGWDDPSCTIIKTPSGAESAITHSGGRCIHDLHPYKKEVLDMMIEQGIEPPPLPFVIAPGEITLYHEWGHFVDLRCS